MSKIKCDKQFNFYVEKKCKILRLQIAIKKLIKSIFMKKLCLNNKSRSIFNLNLKSKGYYSEIKI